MEENKTFQTPAPTAPVPPVGQQPQKPRKTWLIAVVILLIVGASALFYFTDLSKFFKGAMMDLKTAGPPPVCATEDMIAYWKFDEGSGNTIHDSIGNNDGTINGSYEWAQNADGSAALFLDEDAYVDFGNDSSLNLGTSDATILARIKTLDDSAYILTKQDSAYNERRGYGYHMTPNSNAGTSLFWFQDGNHRYELDENGEPLPQLDEEGNTVPNPKNADQILYVECEVVPGISCGANSQYSYIDMETKVNDGQWHFAAGVLDRAETDGGEGKIRTYAEGTDYSHPARNQPADSIDSNANLYIGYNADASVHPNYNYTGLIKDVAIYKKKLTANEIEAIQVRGLQARYCDDGVASEEPPIDLESDLVSHYKFDEITGDIAVEGEIPDAPFGVLKTSAPEDEETFPALVKGILGKALEFNGEDHWADLGNNPLDDGSMTASVWIKFEADQINQTGYIIETSSSIWYLRYNGGQIRFRLGYFEDPGYKFCDTDTAKNLILPGTWTNITATYNHSTGDQTIFIDGKEKKTADQFAFPQCKTIGGNSPFIVGAAETGDGVIDYFNGSIDEIRLYNRALTANEVKALYQQTLDASAVEPEPEAEPEPEPEPEPALELDLDQVQQAEESAAKAKKAAEEAEESAAKAEKEAEKAKESKADSEKEDSEDDTEEVSADSTCLYGGAEYPIGFKYLMDDGCNICECINKNKFECTKKICEIPELKISLEPEFENPFNDLSETHKNKDAILYLKENEIIGGYPDGSFKPNSTVNRAELLKILIEGKGLKPAITSYRNCFEDVGEEWFAPYVCYAAEAGWVDGYEDNTFRPAKTVTKVEALKMLLNSQDVAVPKRAEADPFEDVKTSEWFATYVFTAKELEILEETGSRFDGSDGMTRGGVSENLYRLITD